MQCWEPTAAHPTSMAKQALRSTVHVLHDALLVWSFERTDSMGFIRRPGGNQAADKNASSLLP